MNTKIDLQHIRNSIQQIDVNEKGVEIVDLHKRSNLFSLTEPVFFDVLEQMIIHVKNQKLNGCFIEAGVWSGASAIYLKALLEKYEIKENLWLLDSFGTDIDVSIFKMEKDKIAIKKFQSWTHIKTPTLDDVRGNFTRFNLLDENIKFVQGDIFTTSHLFTDTAIAILRIDLDFYESTLFMLESYYKSVVPGGFVIIDDYYIEEFNCNEAVDKFRRENNITSELIRIGWFSAYWIK